MKRFVCFCIVLSMLFGIFSLNLAAIETNSDCSVLYNVQTDSFLIEKNADKEIFCGFLPRLLICILLVESKADLETKITVAERTRANTPQYSSADIRDGDEISLGDLMNAVLIGNSQEASVALAFHLSEDGTLESVVKRINEKAKELGAEKTNLKNVTGYYDKANPSVTTARDVTKICNYALKLEYILDRSDIKFTMLNVNGVTRPLYTRNSIIESSSSYYYKRATGLAVSGDSNGGFSAVSTILNNNSRFIAVNFSQKSLGNVLNDTVSLLKYALEAYEIRELVKKNDPITEVKVALGSNADYMVLYAEDGLKASLPKSIKDEEIILKIEGIEETVNAPIEAGTDYGYAVYLYNGVEIGRVKLISRTNITLDLIAYYSNEITNLFKNPLLWIAVIVVLVLLVLYIVLTQMKKNKESKDEKIKKRKRIRGKL